MADWTSNTVSHGQNVCELVQVNSVEQPIKSNPVDSRNTSHCRTSAFDDHLDDSFIVFNDVQQSFF